MSNPSGIILAPIGAVYRGVMRARRGLYRNGVLKTHRVSSPVISIGNITTGGTGKTPLVEWIARSVMGQGRRVCVLSRGYERADAGKRVVVSDGERIIAGVREAGDEPYLLAEMLLGAAGVISDADRVAAARWAEENLKSDAFILDDGFQHLRLARDLDIVAVDATNPWGNGKLLPRGRLREPLRELARADCVIITRSEQVADVGALLDQVKQLNERCLVLIARTHTRAVRVLDGPVHRVATSGNTPDPTTQNQNQLSDRSLAAFCAIGNAEAFFEHLRRDGYRLKHSRAFADHHFYIQDDIDEVVSEAKRAGAEALITTAKDGVKLRALNFNLPCYVLEIGFEFDREAELERLIQGVVRRPQT